MKDLSVIIVSYNTKDITLKCLTSLIDSLSKTPQISAEIFIVDNASEDGSVEALEQFNQTHSTSQTDLHLISQKENLGFSKANNIALKQAQGTYVLYLNSDVLIEHVDFVDLINYMDKDEKIGVLTVKVMLQNGEIDPASHRGFPTVWRSFTYFLGFEKTLGKNPLFQKLFGGYHLLHLNLNKTHEIDSPTGAFYLSRRDLLNELGGFDEDFFMYGEDLDLSYRIKEKGYKVVYHPVYSVLHLKSVSGLKKKDDTISRSIRRHFYDAMRIFYQKHYENKYSFFINWLIYGFIGLKKALV